MEDSSLLPQDLFYEILTWVPFETLHSCRQVCTAWRRITYEPRFITLHCRRTTTISGYFIQSMKTNVYSSSFVSFKPMPPSVPAPSLKFLPKGTRILSSTHRGLLCCESPYNHRIPRYYVCKPATQQLRAIPNPRTRFHTKKMAIVATPSGILHFKIVRLSDPRNDFTFTICEIFDSRTWRWRQYNEKIPPLILSPYPSVEINCVVHWLVPCSNAIFAFDVIRETWRLIPLPQWPEEEKKWRDNKLIVGCEEQLFLIRAMERQEISENEIEIWTMVNKSAGEWKRIRSQRLKGLKSRESVDDLYTHQVVFLTSVWEALWLDLKSGEVMRVPVDHLCPRVFKFESDLNSCSLDARIDLLL